MKKIFSFPAPLEVDREIYREVLNALSIYLLEFPAPLEVDREIYPMVNQTQLVYLYSSRPLAR